MANYYTDHPEIAFHLSHPEMKHLVDLREKNYEDAQKGMKYSKPVIFSVLTCNTMEQAEDRAGGKHGNKGVEGAVSALKMLSLEESVGC